MPLRVALTTVDIQGLAVNDTLAVTGFGFSPRLVMHSGVGLSTLNASGAGTSRLSVGASAGNPGRVMSYKQREGNPAQDGVRNSRDDCTLNVLTPSSGLDARLEMVSLDADGYTLREIVVPSAAGATLYNAFGMTGVAFQASTGVFTEPAAPGVQAVTGVGFPPSALILLSNALPTNGSAVDTNCMMGLVGSQLVNAIVAAAANNAGTASARYCRLGESLANFNATSSAIESRGRVTGYAADGFSVTWDAVSGAATNRYFYIALGGVIADVGSLTLTARAAGETNAVAGLSGKPELVLINSSGAAVANAVATPEVSNVPPVAGFNHGFFTGPAARRATGSVVGWDGTFSNSNPTQHDDACLSFPQAGSGFNGGIYDVQSIDAAGFTIVCDQILDLQDRFTVFMSLRDAQDYNAPHLGTD